MESVLDPKLYTGRCAEQVESFLRSVEPLLADASRGRPEINL